MRIIIAFFLLLLSSCVQQEEEFNVTAVSYESANSIALEETSVIYSRITSRSFAQEEITEGVLEEVLKAGFTSPTGGNQHALEFIVIKDQEIMQKIKEVDPYMNICPVVILISGNKAQATYPELLVMDAAMAAENIILRASELSLASVAMSVYPTEIRMSTVSSLCELPQEIEPILMVGLGYPLDSSTGSSTEYYNTSQIHYDTYAK